MQVPAVAAGSTNTVVQTISVTAAATGVYDFRFDGYSLTKVVAGEEDFYQSEAFSVGGHNWAIRYYPNRDNSRVSLYPVLLSRPADDDGRVRASFACTFLDKSGKPASKDIADSASHAFRSGAGEEAWEVLSLRKEAVERFDDCFVVRCTVSVLKKPMSQPSDEEAVG
uniref:MATH domain-containing protein n=1 Tax=Oryza meridionalis TaxID=40149 RepID=A0A0E0C1R8_9ORYZ